DDGRRSRALSRSGAARARRGLGLRSVAGRGASVAAETRVDVVLSAGRQIDRVGVGRAALRALPELRPRVAGVAISEPKLRVGSPGDGVLRRVEGRSRSADAVHVAGAV